MTEMRFNDQNALACPHCENQTKQEGLTAYMHHGTITVFNRREDADDVKVTRVTSNGTTVATVPSSGSGNPSMRRDGLKIEFWCELCGVSSELAISQHKGQTFLEWKFQKAKRRCEQCGWALREDERHHEICFACYEGRQR
jgi:hypothetical protein